MTRVAGTPSSFPPVAAPQTLTELEFDRALEVVAGHAVSDLGAASVMARLPLADPELIREELAAVAELAEELHERGRFEPRVVPDISEVLKSLSTQGSVLDGAALRQLHAALEAMREVERQLSELAEDAPRAAALAVEIPPLRLETAIDRAIEPDGRVKDDASSKLKRARQRLRDTRERLVSELERLKRNLAPHESASEGEVTLRRDRYVIPVRREARGRVRGIVHGESSSGATLFVEPAEVVELGNDLAACEAEEARETLAVLRALTDEARPTSNLIEAGWEMCIAADDLSARARYALAAEARLPAVGIEGERLAVRRGKHPLLLAEGSAVPFDLELEAEELTVVVSGPNAGGKTVLLKAVGLISAMAQAGVIPPVGPGTELPAFQRIFSDIGDHQSIDASLSTFSAHVAALKAILLDVDDRSLVLLDELGGGTDPVEGAALAGAVLLALHGRGPVTIASTHLNQLKELAAETSGVVNASLEFDGETLAPTYRLLMGKPGRSYGLAIARRLGLPDEVLAKAEELTPEHARSVDAILEELERRQTELTRREEEVAAADARLARDTEVVQSEREDAERRTASLAEKERELERTGREQARKFLLEARRRVDEALGLARAAVNEATAKEARRLVEQGVQHEADALDKLEQQARKKGWKIKGSSGEVLAGGDAPPDKAPAVRRSSRPDPHAVIPEISTDVDLRGMRAEEAEAEVIAALDAAVVTDLPFLRIIHGKGTGALRVVVQDLLKRDRRVAKHSLAPPNQGGSGVTIVELRQ